MIEHGTLVKMSGELALSDSRLADYVVSGAWERACEEVNRTQNLLVSLAQGLAQKAYDEGMTKKDIATALGIPARTLRGMEKSA